MSLNIALSGIQAVNGQLSEISNNIANSGTTGFKSGRANFAASYINGLPGGVRIGSTSQSMDIGGNTLATGGKLDAAISGRGYFMTREPNGSLVYTRAGVFGTDENGKIVDFLGRAVQGFGADGGGEVGDLTVPTSAIPAKASSTMAYSGNMSADWKEPAVTPFNMSDPKSYNHMSTQTVFDSLGREHTVNQYFVKTPGNNIEVHYAMDGAATGTSTTMSFDTSGNMTAPSGPVALDLGTPPGVEPMSVALDYSGTTMFAGEPTTTQRGTDGYQSGSVTGVTLTEKGEVEVQYSNGQKLSAGQLAIATFQNENGLVPVSGTGWSASKAAGEPLIGVAGAGMAGKLLVGSVEQSNVDMTAELVNLMGAQQNYQANSKVLSTENEMMRTLMQAL